MFPDICPRNQHPYYTNEDDFPKPLMLVNGFSVKDKLVGMHAQEFLEINIVLDGVGIHYIKKRRLPANKGDVFFILPEYTHGYMGDQNFEVYNVTIHKQFLAKYLTDLQVLPAFSVLFQVEPILRTSESEPLHLSLNEDQLNSLHFLLEEISQYSYPDTYAEALICNNLTIVLISRLCMFYMENVGKIGEKKQKGDKALLDALSLIHDAYQENITVDKLAEVAHLSRSALIRKFREICGMPPHKYLMKQRVEAAIHYLENTDLPLSEIAENAGFYDTAHLTRIFKSETGESPVKYRKRFHSPK